MWMDIVLSSTVKKKKGNESFIYLSYLSFELSMNRHEKGKPGKVGKKEKEKETSVVLNGIAASTARAFPLTGKTD